MLTEFILMRFHCTLVCCIAANIILLWRKIALIYTIVGGTDEKIKMISYDLISLC